MQMLRTISTGVLMADTSVSLGFFAVHSGAMAARYSDTGIGFAEHGRDRRVEAAAGMEQIYI
jgi:hypothetical protein